MGKLPNGERAVVDAAKVRDYLLSNSHPVGRQKALVFRSLGYNAADWPRLQHDLAALASVAQATPGQASPYGHKYEASGTLQGPNGRSMVVVTVWIVRHGESEPRLITAFPR